MQRLNGKERPTPHDHAVQPGQIQLGNLVSDALGITFLNGRCFVAGPFVPGPEIGPHVLDARFLQGDERVRRPRTLEAVEDHRHLLDPALGQRGQNTYDE